MGGSQIRVEGLPAYRASTLRAAASTNANSLEAGFLPSTLTNGALCFVAENGAVYRWSDTSVAAAVDPVIVIPLGQGGGTPGRWILEYPPSGTNELAVTATGTQQDWIPGLDAGAWDMANVLLLQTGGGGNLVIGGLVAPLTSRSPRVKYLYKVTAADNIILSSEDAGSLDPNRLRVPVGATTADAIDESWCIVYADSRWRSAGAVGIA